LNESRARFFFAFLKKVVSTDTQTQALNKQVQGQLENGAGGNLPTRLSPTE
jgi:hypothetical protein